MMSLDLDLEAPPREQLDDTHYISYFSHRCDEMCHRSNLREERFIMAHGSRGISVHYTREGMVGWFRGSGIMWWRFLIS